ncbi:MAG TPA: hypothetical protein VK787_12585 [Puia sp.]|jgi:hypothetical protein|nr:hypothetical protein [Puia sp.]
MKCFNQIQIIIPGKIIIDKAKQFAVDVIDTINYEDSNQFNKEKIKQDHFVSKLDEEAVKQAFEKFGKSVNGPDYTIYQQKEKSWKEDLYVDDFALAVKKQKKSAAIRYGLSWTFQSSSFRRDPILDKKDAWICFVECDDTDNSFSCAVYPPFQTKELILKDPVLPHLKGKKLVAYKNDLPKYD